VTHVADKYVADSSAAENAKFTSASIAQSNSGLFFVH
jgi:hypothetical protein